MYQQPAQSSYGNTPSGGSQYNPTSYPQQNSYQPYGGQGNQMNRPGGQMGMQQYGQGSQQPHNQGYGNYNKQQIYYGQGGNLQNRPSN